MALLDRDGPDTAAAAAAIDESEHERLNRNLDQLLEELRLVLPGVQVLLAFLLTAPFSTRFAELDRLHRGLYLAALVIATAATICLMAPTMRHRLTFRRGQKAEIVRAANRLAIVGITLVAISVTLVLALVADFIYSRPVAIAVAVLAVVLYVGVWYVPGLRARRE